MRKIINGKLYDTDTAVRIGRRECGTPGDLDYFSETLYQKKTGELFIHGKGGPRSCYSESCGNNSWSGGSVIIPASSFSDQFIDIKEWVSEYCDVETYIKLFGPVAE